MFDQQKIDCPEDMRKCNRQHPSGASDKKTQAEVVAKVIAKMNSDGTEYNGKNVYETMRELGYIKAAAAASGPSAGRGGGSKGTTRNVGGRASGRGTGSKSDKSEELKIACLKLATSRQSEQRVGSQETQNMLKPENICVLHDQRNHPEVEQVFPADEIVPGPHYDRIHYGPLDRMEQHMLDLRHAAEKTQRSVPASAGGGKWQQHEVYLVGDNGNAHHVRVYENNLFYIKLQLGAPGGVDVGAVADSIVRGASEVASEAS